MPGGEVKVKIDADTIIETDDLTPEELSDIDDNFFARIKEAEARIKIAKGNVGKLIPSELEWLHKANLALSLSNRNRQRLLRAILQKRDELKRQRALEYNKPKDRVEKSQDKIEREIRFERLFMQVVEEHVSPIMYRDLIAKTKALFGSKREEDLAPISDNQAVI